MTKVTQQKQDEGIVIYESHRLKHRVVTSNHESVPTETAT